MTLATNKRPKTAIVPKQAIDHASLFLQELPEKPKENMSLREAVNRLRDQILTALAKGYSYADIATMLTDKGIEISASTLKNYVPSGRRQAAKDKASDTKPNRAGKPQSEPLLETEPTPTSIPISQPVAPPASSAKTVKGSGKAVSTEATVSSVESKTAPAKPSGRRTTTTTAAKTQPERTSNTKADSKRSTSSKSTNSTNSSKRGQKSS